MADEWKDKLSDNQYKVLREKATEPPFTGALLNNNSDGDYICAACGSVLFKSDTKFEAPFPNHGWPSFYDTASEGAVEIKQDSSHGMERLEAVCKKCGGHLGHLFNDGDPQNNGGAHFCINSASLNFKSKDGDIIRGDGEKP